MNQRKLSSLRRPLRKTVAVGLLLLASLSARAWEVGVINTWIHNDAIGGGGLAHGFSVMVEEDLCRYADVGGRIGYMRSDCALTYYIPLELTASVKYPLCNDHFVPFFGIIGEYRVFTSSKQDLENAFGASPMFGFNWYFGEKKQWSLYIEGRYQFLQADVSSGPAEHSRFDGPGGSWGVAFRF